MSEEIKSLIENTKDRDGLARLFDRIAETIGAPLEFKRDNEPPEPVHKDAEAYGDAG